MKKIILLIMAVLVVAFCGCGGTKELSYEEQVREEMKEALNYYDDFFATEISKHSKVEDIDKLIECLEEGSVKADEYVDLFLGYMTDKELSKETQDIAMNLKTGYYIFNSQAVKPMLAYFKGEVPDYVEYNTLHGQVWDAYMKKVYYALH